jgi:RND family efflux transporter MFP subunit
VTQAEASLALAMQPYTAQDIEQQKNAVVSAQQALSLAQHPYTDQDLQTAEAGVAQAQVGVDQARQAVTDTIVTAPVAGIITQKPANEGGLASAAAPIVSISSDLVKVQVPIEESQVPNLKLGEAATIGGSVLGSATITGKVTNVAPSGDTKSRTFTADVTPDQAGDLRPGMFVQVTIALQEHQNVTSVPTSAIVSNVNGTFVFVVENGIAHEVAVTTGLANPTLTEITQGVSPGQRVVVQSQQRLNDGDRVATTTAPAG